MRITRSSAAMTGSRPNSTIRVDTIIASNVLCSRGSLARPTYRLTADAASFSLLLCGRRRTNEGLDLKLPYSILHLEQITRFLVGGGSDAALNPYMVGGSWFSNRPMLETVRLCEEIATKKSNRSYPGPSCKKTTPGLRSASKSESHYHEWESKYDVGDMPEWIHTKATNNVLEIDPKYLTENWSI